MLLYHFIDAALSKVFIFGHSKPILGRPNANGLPVDREGRIHIPGGKL